MKQFKRVFLIVADSAGIGEEPDAAKFDDVGTNTWVHAAQSVGGIHGNDPTYKGTDHTREKVPLLVYSPSITNGKMLEERSSFADIGATILDNYAIEKAPKMIGESIREILD